MTRSSRSHFRGADMRRVSFNLALPFASALLVTSILTAGAAGQTDDHPHLPPGEGRDVMIRVCSQCHEPELAADQQFDEAGWKSLVDQMASKGADATEPEFETIVAYLAKAFPASK